MALALAWDGRPLEEGAFRACVGHRFYIAWQDVQIAVRLLMNVGREAISEQTFKNFSELGTLILLDESSKEAAP